MFAKSFLALEGNGGLSDALTAPYDRYTDLPPRLDTTLS